MTSILVIAIAILMKDEAATSPVNPFMPSIAAATFAAVVAVSAPGVAAGILAATAAVVAYGYSLMAAKMMQLQAREVIAAASLFGCRVAAGVGGRPSFEKFSG